MPKKQKIWISKIFSFIRESIQELKKVQWPTKKETISFTLIVIVISTLVALYLTLCDNLYRFILNLLI